MNKEFYMQSASEVLTKLHTTKNGLSEKEAQKRLTEFGENKLADTKQKNLIKVFFKQFLDIMTLILLVASAISMVIALINKSYSELVDGLIILGIVLVNAIIGFCQERKADKSMEELKKLTLPEAKVIRNGEVQKIHSKDLVIGDIVVLEAGDIVPADARIIECVGFKCDESALTGESVPTEKDAKSILPHNTVLAERNNMVFSSSIVASGRASAIVTDTGHNTEIGKIATLLSETQATPTPLQIGIKQLGKLTTILIMIICAITFVIEIIATPSEPLEAFLTAVAIAVAAIPESLPAVITIIMSLGIARMAKQKAIIKNLHAIETLGCCQVICTDKTGTLTQNKMEVQSVFCGGKSYDINSLSTIQNETKKLLDIMMLCESVEHGHNGYVGDPTEVALVNFAEKVSKTKRKVFEQEKPLIDELPFDSNRKLMSSVHETQNGAVVMTKGAVDELLKICTYIEENGQIKPLLPFQKEKILRVNKEMASNALRVLGFAYKTISKNNFLKQKIEENLVFVGLAGMLDPPRKEVKKAVEKCINAGIKPVMITGDHKNTALAIARRVGIANTFDEVITGTEIDKLTLSELKKIVEKKTVFARVSPEHKVKIVDAFKQLGKIVAMTGDGVNDAPSIKKANIGIGMGQNGTDVTKETAAVIITDDNFATIILAVQEGRKTYTNIQKTVQFLFSANLAEITAIFLATIFMPQLVFLTPVQILFVNLLSDTLPAIALGVEPAEHNLMTDKPRNVKKGLLGNGVGTKILLIGIIQGLIMLCCFLFGYYYLHDQTIATTMAFYSLNIVQFFYFVSVRTKESAFKNSIFNNKLAVLAVLTCFAFILLVACTPICSLLGLCTLPFSAWLFIAFACITMFFISEISKKISRK